VRNPFRRHPLREEDLSAYLDGRLPTARSARLEEHLAACEPCRQRLEGLRAVVEGLRALPSMAAPRSFALRPEQVTSPARPMAWAQRASAFGPAGAAAAAALLFIVLVGVDLGTMRGGGPEAVETEKAGAQAYGAEVPGLSAAPAPTPQERSAADAQEEAGAPAATAEAPAPAEAPAEATPPGGAEEEGGAGRWVLRGFQAAAGVAFLVAVAVLIRQRRGAPGSDGR